MDEASSEFGEDKLALTDLAYRRPHHTNNTSYQKDNRHRARAAQLSDISDFLARFLYPGWVANVQVGPESSQSASSAMEMDDFRVVLRQ